MTVLPYTAQANFDDVSDPGYGPEDVLDTGARADVATCPGPGHAAHGAMGVLRRPEAFLNERTALLPTDHPAIIGALLCADAGATPYTGSTAAVWAPCSARRRRTPSTAASAARPRCSATTSPPSP